MLPEAYVCHKIPGRLRIRIPSRKGNEVYFSSLGSHFSRFQGFEKLEVNEVTGSVLFVGEADVEEIADYALGNQLFVLRGAGSPPTPVSQRILGEFGQINGRLRRFTGGEIDLASLAFVALVSAGLYQISIGEFIAPAWYTAFWYATNISLKANTGGAGNPA